MHKNFVLMSACVLLGCALSGCKTQTSPQEDNATTETTFAEYSTEIETTSKEQTAATKIDFPSTYMVENEKNYIDYQSGPDCSAFSSAYLLRHYGVKASGSQLFETFPGKLPDGNGVYPQGIVSFFLDQGYEAEFVCDATVEQLKQELAKGAPVIVFIHGAYPYTSTHNTHYVPIIGYDEMNFYFADSAAGLANCKDDGLAYNRKTDIETFMKLWANIDSTWDYPYFSIIPPKVQ